MSDKKPYLGGLNAGFVFLLGIVAVYWLGALTTVLVVPWIQSAGGVIEEQLLRKGPHRLMSRMSMIWLVVFLCFFLKWIGWKGFSDCGLKEHGSTWSLRRSLKDCCQGIFLGLITLGLATVVMLATGTRTWVGAESIGALLAAVGSLAVSGIVVALIEETVARGIIFRSLARAWHPWAAAIVISILFGFSHFIRPLESAFDSSEGAVTTWRVLSSVPGHFETTSNVFLRATNISLMSLVLCVFVMRTRTVWLAVGAHAAWVWVKKFSSHVTNSTAVQDGWSWIGVKSDSTDSLLATAMLLALLTWAARGKRVKEEQA